MADSIPLSRRLEYAQGYIGLGMLDDAVRELDAIPADTPLPIEAIQVRMDLYSAAKRWDLAVECARRLAAEKPDEPQGWIGWAYAERRLNGIPAAEKILLAAEALIGATCALVHYNLACYRCQLGDLVGAKARLTKACRMDASFRQLALQDEDLIPLRADVASL